MEENMDLENHEDLVGTESVLTRSQPTAEQFNLSEMSTQVSLVPSNLARPPVMWSAQEVKAWLEFCVEEFSLRPVCVDKFDMNGKALLLLTRTDFIERAPHAGDVLFNVFQRLLQNESLGSLKSSVFLSTPVHATTPASDIWSRSFNQTANIRSSYIPIRPQPQHSIGTNSSREIYPTSTNSIKSCSIILAANEDDTSVGPSVPACVLSPAPSEKCPSETDSCNNEHGRSPHTSDHDGECDEVRNSDHGCEVKYDATDQSEDGVCRLLWEFVYQLLQDVKCEDLVCWESEDELTFRIVNPTNLADAWGKQKNRSNMTYEKLSRALRYYYKMQIITKVPGKRLTYKFLQHPAKIRKGQRGARPHSNRNATARAVDAELVTTTEPAAPDSSTCLPVRTLSTSSTTSTVHLFLNDPRNDAEPHHVSDELPENHSPRSYYHENPQIPFLRSSDGIRMSIQDQESPLYQDTTFEESRMAKSAHRSISSSPRHHSELLQRHQLKLYETDKQSESDDQYIIHRSKYLPSTTSPHFHQNSRSSLDRDLKSAPNLSIIGADVYTNKIHLPVSPLKQRSPLVTHNNHLIPHHKLDQDFTQEADIISRAISPSTLSIPTAFRSIESHMRSATTVPSDNKHQIFHGKYHPYSHPMHYNHKPPMQPYAYEQLRSNHLPVHYNKGTLQHNHINIFPPDTDPRSQIVNDPYSIRHSVKHEEQDEPEDLSLKPCLKKESVNASTSDPDHSHGLGLIDTHRDSPRSNSSDSAYGSDQADFGKDISVENLHE